MSGIEVAAAKSAAPFAKAALPWFKWGWQRLRPDHGPIRGCPNMLTDHRDRFVLTVAVAPSDTAKTLPPRDFVPRAHELANLVLRGRGNDVQHSGSTQVRVAVRDSNDPVVSERHQLVIYPSGLVILHHGLDVAISPDSIGPIPIGELLSVTRHIHEVAQSTEYQSVHQHRQWEKARRLDWRIGLCSSISGTNGPRPWMSFDDPASASFKKGGNAIPYCPPAGYAQDALKGLKSNRPIEPMLRVVVEQLLAEAGYLESPLASTSEVNTQWSIEFPGYSEDRRRQYRQVLILSNRQSFSGQATRSHGLSDSCRYH
jgi:hypothetical protein